MSGWLTFCNKPWNKHQQAHPGKNMHVIVSFALLRPEQRAEELQQKIRI